MKKTTAIMLATAGAFLNFCHAASAAQNVDTAAALIAAVRDGAEGIFPLSLPLPLLPLSFDPK